MDELELQIGEPDKNLHPNIDLNYYYSREKRLEHTPFRNKDTSPKSGLIRSLIDTPPKFMLFITIAVLCVIIVVLAYVVN
jgi:hypothetical protein